MRKHPSFPWARWRGSMSRRHPDRLLPIRFGGGGRWRGGGERGKPGSPPRPPASMRSDLRESGRLRRDPVNNGRRRPAGKKSHRDGACDGVGQPRIFGPAPSSIRRVAVASWKAREVEIRSCAASPYRAVHRTVATPAWSAGRSCRAANAVSVLLAFWSRAVASEPSENPPWLPR